MIVPDYIEPLTGWRAWTAEATRANEGELLLGLNSLYYELSWPRAEAVQARCEYGGRGPCHDHDHLCGIHAAHTLDRLSEYLPSHVRNRPWASHSTQVIIGRVSIWGDVAEHEDGWRGEFAYPSELYVPSVYRARGLDIFAADACEMLSRAYPETTVRVVRDLADLIDLAAAA